MSATPSAVGMSTDTLLSLQTAKANAAPAAGSNAKSAAGRAYAAAQDFEAVFLSSMFKEMFTDIDGEGPFGGGPAVGVWRSFLTDQFAKSFAKAGGVGIAAHVYNELLKQQGVAAS